MAREKATAAGLVDLRQNVKPKTVRNAHSPLAATLESVVEHITRNMTRGAPLPKDNIEDEKELSTGAEWDRFYNAMQEG